MSPTSKVTNWFAATAKSGPFGASIGTLESSSGGLQALSGALEASRRVLQTSSGQGSHGALQASRRVLQASSRSVGLRTSSTLPRQESGFVDDNVEDATRDLLARIPTKKRKRIIKMHKGNVKTF
uniref:Uncharacterized protein n=1 Tax=Cacopsylla melanoneura TaxID=428564 RepID=A0A8D8YUU6_9HEMI